MNNLLNTSQSSTHIIVVPSYNSGILLKKTINQIVAHWSSVMVVVDGSNDDSDAFINSTDYPYLKLIKLQKNQGKGAAILKGALHAHHEGFTHILIIDADDQHPVEAISTFMQTSIQHPNAIVLGEPIFDSSAPAIRVQGRKISNFFVHLETMSWNIHDSLFGMRVYPIDDLIAVMKQTFWARRFDFEPEISVRLAWRGLKIINIPTSVRYINKVDGGISHFHYLRDNSLLIWMHIRLLTEFLIRLPNLIFTRLF